MPQLWSGPGLLWVNTTLLIKQTLSEKMKERRYAHICT
ncbi:hypothetical protein EL80_5155 [Escherichia coli]|nr:hypothetical protein EC970259_3605 [Escherichia coli 99.0741]KGM76211.1 hypothetical protein EL80_5155 [Escherichia coli]